MSSNSEVCLSPPLKKKKTKMAAGKTAVSNRESGAKKQGRLVKNGGEQNCKSSTITAKKTGSRGKRGVTAKNSSTKLCASPPKPSLTGSSRPLGLGVGRKSSSGWTPPGDYTCNYTCI